MMLFVEYIYIYVFVVVGIMLLLFLYCFFMIYDFVVECLYFVFLLFFVAVGLPFYYTVLLF